MHYWKLIFYLNRKTVEVIGTKEEILHQITISVFNNKDFVQFSCHLVTDKKEIEQIENLRESELNAFEAEHC